MKYLYVQGSEKTGGYVNRLVVTCLRSGLNRTFRVMQKPERAPIRALRSSSSGRSANFLFYYCCLLLNLAVYFMLMLGLLMNNYMEK